MAAAGAVADLVEAEEEAEVLADSAAAPAAAEEHPAVGEIFRPYFAYGFQGLYLQILSYRRFRVLDFDLKMVSGSVLQGNA